MSVNIALKRAMRKYLSMFPDGNTRGFQFGYALKEIVDDIFDDYLSKSGRDEAMTFIEDLVEKYK